jgi:drug/metabolite transporter (DMT)-like permease
MLLWGSYSIFGERATRIHGEKVSFVFEVLGMILIAMVVFGLFGGLADFKKVTSVSITNAIIMGLLTSLGAFMLLYALRVVPSVNQVPIVVVIAGFYPVVTAILSYFFLGSRLSPIQWLGVALAGVALALVNWTK